MIWNVCLHLSSQDPLKFCSEHYSCRRYKEAYSHTIRTIPDTELLPEMQGLVIKPPPLKRAIRRPTKNRKRAVDKERRGKKLATVKCSSLMSKTCKGGLTAKEKNKKKTTTHYFITAN